MKDFNRVLEMDKSHAEANKAAMVSVTYKELLNGALGKQVESVG